jgi:hypothetical protein
MRHEDDDDYGLPRTMSMDVLENEQYMLVFIVDILPRPTLIYISGVSVSGYQRPLVL